MPPLAVHPTEANIEWLSRDSCGSYCEQRQEKLRKDEEALESMRDELVASQKYVIVRGICGLNRDVKKLTVGEFNVSFGCDVVDLIRKQMTAGDVGASGKKRFRAAGVSQQSATGSDGLSLITPAAHRMGKPPMTRTARRGEIINSYSVNGSPIDPFDHGEVVVTAKKRVKDNSGKGTAVSTPFPISIGIGAGNGETIDLSDPNERKNLDGEQKAQAMQQLMAIQDQMNKLMADF